MSYAFALAYGAHSFLTLTLVIPIQLIFLYQTSFTSE
ncbi:hypothetical protein XNC3_800028 [Xenorhabdus nematophila F1]|nr:hypothetical protein XNC3_800028 [Xenorhabdus nematophila F1]CDH29211.1 hypothetical protein XBJ2_2360029 [Xenorhabdus bovienii str. Jollieti]CEK21024.1 protein of unknown function [Xenorhabdus nematophila AN6/1]